MALFNLNLGLEWSRGYSLVRKSPPPARFAGTNLEFGGTDSKSDGENQRGFTTTNDRLRCRQTERTCGWLGSSDWIACW